MSLRGRVLALLVGLVLVTQVATSLAVLRATERDAQTGAVESLRAAGRVFDRLLADREARLQSTVEILVSDFGLKRAVATSDLPTIESVLENHGDRIAADAALMLALDGRVAAAFPPGALAAGLPDGLHPLLEAAERRDGATGLILLGGAPHQIVVVPIKAPLRIGWVCMGFRLDDALAAELRELTGIEVSFWGRAEGARAAAVASTLASPEREALQGALAADELAAFEERPRLLPGSDSLTLSIPLAGRDVVRIGAVLQTSLHAALASYRELRAELILLFAAGVVLALGGALATARGITRPVNQLAAVARRIAAGDYLAEVEVRSNDELGVLASSFRAMQKAIAEREAEILHRASHDGLTGLPNRTVVEAGLESILRERDPSHPLEVGIVDLERLKDINSALGQEAGDSVLRAVASRLSQGVGGSGFVARFGGDEFLVALEARDGDGCQALLRAIEAPIRAEAALVRLRASAGFARFPEDGSAPADLLSRAELALARGKAEGARLSRYQQGSEEANQRRIAILSALERAIAADALCLHYQPKVSLATGRVVGVEALVRWTDPELGPMRPDEFVALAEQAGNVRALTDWVLREALAQQRRWAVRGIDLTVAVNLSALDLCDRSLPAILSGMLLAAGVPSARFGVEVTESAVMADPELGFRLLQDLRERGIAVAIDDFGTGHSSLAQLKTLPADTLKIDKAFISGLREGTADEVIVRSAIALAHMRGLEVVAEGVEDAACQAMLARFHCDAVQGYGISRPLPAADLPAWLDRYTKNDDEEPT
jgi:diguanylate cyclase (GGDEF)-like protein